MIGLNKEGVLGGTKLRGDAWGRDMKRYRRLEGRWILEKFIWNWIFNNFNGVMSGGELMVLFEFIDLGGWMWYFEFDILHYE